MKKLTSFFSSVLFCAVILIFSGCQTTFFGTDTENLPVVQTGKIVQNGLIKLRKAEKNDIDIQQTMSIPLTIIGILVESWSGSVTANGQKQPLLIAYQSETKSGNASKNIYNININKLPDIFAFEPFEISDKIIALPKDMPMKIAAFSIDGKPFYLRVAGMGIDPSKTDSKWGQTLPVLMGLSGQKLRIMDDDDRIYAEFDENTYKIFATGTGVSIDQLQTAIGAFAVVWTLCK